MRYFIVLFCIVYLPYSLFSQEKRPLEFSGYASNMFTALSQNLNDRHYWQNVVHNRLSLGWNPGENWRIDAGIRNRLFSGDLVGYSLYAKGIDFDKGWVDMSWNLIDHDDALLNMSCDRLFVTFEKEKWCLRLGRQRVNWGQTFVWNPNDLFNAYSFFDFDYVERPGCDAFRGTYYHNETSFSELVVSVDQSEKVTTAFLHHGNINNFDYQIIAGYHSQSDVVLGGGWSGDLKGVNFRGEFSYYRPAKHFMDTTGIINISVGVDYIFSNSLLLQGEVSYNNTENILSIKGISNLLSDPFSTKFVSMNKWNYFGQALYPITPHLSVSVSGMYMAGLKVAYGGVFLDYSIFENLDISVISQYFSTIGNTYPIDVNAWLGFARLKYSF